MKERISMDNSSEKRNRIPLWVAFICDLLAVAAFTLTFAYFHHVRPKIGDQFGEQITKPSVTQKIPDDDGSDIDSGSDETSQTPAETDRFEDMFSSFPVYGDLYYSDKNVRIKIKQHSEGIGNSKITFYVADIYTRTPEVISAAFAKDTYGSGLYEYIKPIAERADALFAVSGDYYGSSENGIVIRNGTIYRNNDTSSDICVLYYDGTVSMYSPDDFDMDECREHGAWQAWTFGPILVSDGSALKKFNTTSYLSKAHPRCGLGYYEPGHYCIVLVDGRQEGYSAGVTMAEFADIFDRLGVQSAYNLDGGRSAVMVFKGEYVNKPWSGGRPICDIIYIGGGK